jgi:hypothetical protein
MNGKSGKTGHRVGTDMKYQFIEDYGIKKVGS